MRPSRGGVVASGIAGVTTATYWIFGSILLYSALHAISFGPITWLVLAEIFPENVRFRASATEPGARVLRWVDPRVLGPRWQGAFLRLRASDPLHVLGPPPGVT